MISVPRSPRKSLGFSLTELLCVMGCVAVAAGILGGTTWHVQSSMKLRNTAEEFLQTVKSARHYAVTHRCRTRLAFRAGLFSHEAGVATDERQRTYRIHAFIDPTSNEKSMARWVELGGASMATSANSSREWAPMKTLPRSESLVGRWLVCDQEPIAHLVPDVVKVSSPLFEQFAVAEREVFFRQNFYAPETFWGQKQTEHYAPLNCFSGFPDDFWKTPVDAGPVLLTDRLPEDERCVDPRSGGTVAASQFWPGTVNFIRGVHSSRYEELPGIEFQPDGSLACMWTRELEFRFAPANRSAVHYVVLINSGTGLARIKQLEVE